MDIKTIENYTQPNKYLNKYVNNKIKTFQTNEKIYNDFKKTYLQLDIGIGDKLTDLMKEFIEKHNSSVDVLNLAGKNAQLEKLPHLFENKEYWKQYFIFASYETCKKIRIRLHTLLTNAKHWESIARQAEGIDWKKEFNYEFQTDKIQSDSDSGHHDTGLDELFK